MTEPDAIQRARKAVRGRYGADAIAVQAGLICELIALASLAKPQPVGGALTADQIDDIATQHGDWLEYQEEWVFTNHELIQFARDIEAATLSAPVAQPGEAVSEAQAAAMGERVAWMRRPEATPIAEPVQSGVLPLPMGIPTYDRFGKQTKAHFTADQMHTYAARCMLHALTPAAPAQAAAVPSDVLGYLAFQGAECVFFKTMQALTVGTARWYPKVSRIVPVVEPRTHAAPPAGISPAPLAGLREALFLAEAALADIGDADREPGDDVAWCEARAAQALPIVRAALSLGDVSGEGEGS